MEIALLIRRLRLNAATFVPANAAAAACFLFFFFPFSSLSLSLWLAGWLVVGGWCQ